VGLKEGKGNTVLSGSCGYRAVDWVGVRKPYVYNDIFTVSVIIDKNLISLLG
jgi:hypothetical protein